MMTQERLASDISVKYLVDLMTTRNYSTLVESFPDTENGRAWRQMFSDIEDAIAGLVDKQRDPYGMADELTFDLIQSDVSKFIDALKKCPRETTVAQVPAEQEAEVTEGIYKVAQTIYKVQRSQRSGKLYAKELQIDSEPVDGGNAICKFVYSAGAMYRIKAKHKLTYEQAKEFGAMYGICCCCGRLLSNELSVYLGIGPICGGREFGGEFKLIVDMAKAGLR